MNSWVWIFDKFRATIANGLMGLHRFLDVKKPTNFFLNMATWMLWADRDPDIRTGRQLLKSYQNGRKIDWVSKANVFVYDKYGKIGKMYSVEGKVSGIGTDSIIIDRGLVRQLSNEVPKGGKVVFVENANKI
jgi:hypothetical protein